MSRLNSLNKLGKRDACLAFYFFFAAKSEHDQEIPQSQTADQLTASLLLDFIYHMTLKYYFEITFLA